MDREDWDVDQEGNLTPPGELVPDTDEFGRDDPAALERERRRRERELRRRGKKPKAEKSSRGVTGSFGRLLGGRRKERAPRRRDDRDAGAAQAAGAPEAAPPSDPAEAAPSAAPREDAVPPPNTAPPGGYRRRRLAAIVIALGGILLVWFLIALFQPFAGDGKGEGTVSLDIPEGASAGEIAEILDEAGVVTSARLFEWRLKLAGKSDDVQADTYTLAEGMSYGAAIDRLTGEDTGGLITVTIPEGLSRDQIASDVLPEGVSSEEYLELTKAPPQGFNPAEYGAKSNSLEGFLFPATYELQAGQGVPALVQQQLDAFRQNIAKVDMSYAKKKNLTVYDVLIIASMVDKEVQVPKERPLVAAVIYNRLNQGVRLGIDATTRYETNNYTEQIPQSAFEQNTPYNTRLNQGLTPTPIGNPGLDAIRAAANPERVNYLYFVVKPGTCGEHSFTASEKEFERLAAEYQAALQAEGGSPTECPE